MGMMFRRRRPIARMAVVGATAGVAYHMGKSHEQQQQANDRVQAAYDDAEQQPPQYAPPPAAPAAAAGPPQTADLDHLIELHNSGVLTDQEFSAAKAKLLGL